MCGARAFGGKRAPAERTAALRVEVDRASIGDHRRGLHALDRVRNSKDSAFDCQGGQHDRRRDRVDALAGRQGDVRDAHLLGLREQAEQECAVERHLHRAHERRADFRVPARVFRCFPVDRLGDTRRRPRLRRRGRDPAVGVLGPPPLPVQHVDEPDDGKACDDEVRHEAVARFVGLAHDAEPELRHGGGRDVRLRASSDRTEDVLARADVVVELGVHADADVLRGGLRGGEPGDLVEPPPAQTPAVLVVARGRHLARGHVPQAAVLDGRAEAKGRTLGDVHLPFAFVALHELTIRPPETRACTGHPRQRHLPAPR